MFTNAPASLNNMLCVEQMSHPIAYFRGVEYTGSYPSVGDCPSSSEIPVVAFTGRSNSGKSSLISALCDHKNLARTSGSPGKTKTLNYFFVPPSSIGHKGLYLVDMPGFGYAKISQAERQKLYTMIDTFLLKAENILLTIIVLDARREMEDTEKNIAAFCGHHQKEFLFARTKWDTLNHSEKAKTKKKWTEQNLDSFSISCSSTKKNGIDLIVDRIRFAAQSWRDESL